MKNLIHYNRNASMFSVHLKSLYQSTKIWLCPDRSPCNNVLISVETDFDPRNDISVFHSFLPCLELGLFRLLSRFLTYIQIPVVRTILERVVFRSEMSVIHDKCHLHLEKYTLNIL